MPTFLSARQKIPMLYEATQPKHGQHGLIEAYSTGKLLNVNIPVWLNYVSKV
jgi:hypothetical protein